MKTWQCALFSAAFHGLVFFIQPAVLQMPKEPDKDIIKLLVLEKPALTCEAQAASAPVEKATRSEAAKEPPSPPPPLPQPKPIVEELKETEPIEKLKAPELEPPPKLIEEVKQPEPELLPELIEEVKRPEPELLPESVEIVKLPEPEPVKKIDPPKKKQAAPKKKIQQVVKKEKVKQPEKKRNPVKPPEKIVQPVVKQKVPAPATENIQAAVSLNKENLSAINNKRISNTSSTEVKADKMSNPLSPVAAEFGALGGPKFARRVMPKYPKVAQRLGIEGEVTLKLLIDASGTLIKVEVVKGAGRGFDEEAVRAVKHSKFSPAVQNGNPVGCVALIKIQFKLNS
ncbi:MAG: energy transducer TonB [Desulfamplus sp.]|nr:energy transducer TonB [Desulfamplus sp.]